MNTKNYDEDLDDIVSEINMTPLIDIMLVLLIIFMVTSSMVLESGLDIDLPKTISKTKSKEGNAVLISLDKTGVISVQGTKTTMEALQVSVEKAIETSNSSLVIFEGDKKSDLGLAIQIMDIAKTAGAEKFAIATERAKN